MIEPIAKTIEVPCAQDQAFDIFIKQMQSWWPLGKFTYSAMQGTPAKGIRVAAKSGGEIVELGCGSGEISWGKIVDVKPHDFLSMDFHIPAPGGPEVPGLSRVEVRFTKVADSRTRVDLKQINWEAFGKHAEMLRGGYGHGWEMIFVGAYQAACARAAA